MKIIKCNSCNGGNEDTNTICKYCGNPLEIVKNEKVVYIQPDNINQINNIDSIENINNIENTNKVENINTSTKKIKSIPFLLLHFILAVVILGILVSLLSEFIMVLSAYLFFINIYLYFIAILIISCLTNLATVALGLWSTFRVYEIDQQQKGTFMYIIIIIMVISQIIVNLESLQLFFATKNIIYIIFALLFVILPAIVPIPYIKKKLKI